MLNTSGISPVAPQSKTIQVTN